MTDYRALCAELLLRWDVDGCDWKPQHQARWNAAIERVRTALAQPEPAGDVSDDELEELAEDLEWKRLSWQEGSGPSFALELARAAIALDRSRQPAPPAEGEPIDRSQLSDGYHTFAELYEHRHALMLAFMRAAPDLCWFSRRHADGGLCFGSGEWFIVGAELPDSGTVTYHLPMRLWGLAEMTGAAELELGRPWDGHTANDVVQRLNLLQWATRPSPPPEQPIVCEATWAGEVGELVAWLHTYASEEFGPSSDHPDAETITRAAIALDRSRQPAPAAVPVAERFPFSKECDDDGFLWLGVLETDPLLGAPHFSLWTYEECRKVGGWYYTHFLPHDTLLLPARAMPLPQAGEVQ